MRAIGLYRAYTHTKTGYSIYFTGRGRYRNRRIRHMQDSGISAGDQTRGESDPGKTPGALLFGNNVAGNGKDSAFVCDGPEIRRGQRSRKGCGNDRADGLPGRRSIENRAATRSARKREF